MIPLLLFQITTGPVGPVIEAEAIVVRVLADDRTVAVQADDRTVLVPDEAETI